VAIDLAIGFRDPTLPVSVVGSITRSLNVNIRGVCMYEVEGNRTLHLLLEEEANLTQALAAQGLAEYTLTDVVVLDLQDRPGVFEAVMAAVDAADIRLRFAYTSGVWLVLGATDPARLRAELGRAFKLDDPDEFGGGVIKRMDPSVVPLIESTE
jgi:hypothetical protein